MPEKLKNGVVTLAVVKRNLRAYFLARGLCNKGTRGALQNHGACMSQTRKAVAALFAVTVSTAVGIGYIHLEQTEERKVCPSARRETSQSVPNSRLDAARSTRDTPRDGSNDGVIPLPSYIDVSASQRAPKPTRPVCLNLESPC